MIDFNDSQSSTTKRDTKSKEIRLIKLNSNRNFKANSTLDNLFKSIRKRKLKHPINCFNRKNFQLQLLLSYPTEREDYSSNLDNSTSINKSNNLTQSEINLAELENSESIKYLSQGQRRLRRSRSSVGEFEYLNMDWLKAIRNSVETTTSSLHRSKEDSTLANKPSFNNLIKLDFKTKDKKNRDTIESIENAGVRLLGFVDSNQITKDLKDLKQTSDKSLECKSPSDCHIKSPTSKDKLIIDNRLVEDLFKDELKDNEFNQVQIETNEQINIENLIDDALSFPVGEWVRVDCEICFQECWLNRRVCCNYAACSTCLSQYFQERVSLGSFSIECINNRCNLPVNRNEISISLEPKFKEIYHNLLRANNDLGKLTRTCPNCNSIHKLKDNSELKKMRKNRKKDPLASSVKCEECNIQWCFLCHSPWHFNITCKQFIAGDRLLRDWAKQFAG